ncbi:MAG: transglycosylase domain-containing protein [Pseudomonadales bacterium]
MTGRLRTALVKFTLAAMSLAALALVGYLFYLDRLITTTFEGRRWSVPAVVYAQPLELYSGVGLRLADVTGELDRLGYRQLANLTNPGTYKRTGADLSIHLRAFHFMERARASQRIAIGFNERGISNITDASGRPVTLIRLDPLNIGSFFPSHGEDRLILPPAAVPVLLLEALKAVEDVNFDSHLGFDLRGIARAIWVDIRSGELKQGGSTLTQQLVKSYYLSNRRTLERKLRELAMAIILDARFTKEDLLNAYVNEIYLGQDGNRAVHGFGLGSQFYFNKPLAELKPFEVATLIAIIRGPSYYNPNRHPERVLQRRNRILAKMYETGLIDVSTHETNRLTPLNVITGARSGGAYYPAFMDIVRSTLASRYDEEDLTSQGLRVFTTLSPRDQDAVERAMAEGLAALDQRQHTFAPTTDDRKDPLQGAAIVASTQTGEILALAGGRTAGIDGFNRALNARRPVGSLLKPVVYLTALERGYHLASELQDVPVTLPLVGQAAWQPSNFDGTHHGPVPLLRALGDSLNLATVHLGLSIGVDQVALRLEELTGQPPANRYPSLLLGAESLTPIEVLGIYGTFASGGFYMPPKPVIAVLNESGAPVSHHRFELEQRIAADHAAEINRALEIVMLEGTGKSSQHAQLGVAGKTGTSDDYRDSWFVGYDNRRLVVVWLGYDDNRPTGLTGAAGALKVWDRILTRLGIEALPRADKPGWATVEYTSGLLAAQSCARVIQIPLPDDAVLQSKPGCGINFRSMRNHIRASSRSWSRSRPQSRQ